MIRTLLSFAWAVLTLLLAASCTDTVDGPMSSVPTGKGNVRLNLPGIVFADESAGSRADADATEDERAVTSLWFMAYPIDGNGTQLVQRLYPTSDNKLTHEYESFDITLAHGDYQVYVVANVDGISIATTEQQLNDMLLSYSADNLPSKEGGLPMAYKHDGTFTVDQDAADKELKADLVFCCSKVRYTLLFENGEGSEFGNNYLTIGKVTGRNFATQTPVIPQKGFTPEDYFETKDGALNGKYITGTYTEDDENLTFNQDAPENNGNWAYRGSFYVPENLNADNNTKTSNMAITANLSKADGTPVSALEYTINLGGKDGEDPNDSETPLPLPRGMYYDIIARINSVGELVIISAKIQEWTVETVTAELEAPYTLWVEETVVGTFEIPLESGDVIQMGCRTDAPVLHYESVKFDDNTDLFDVDFQQKDGKYTGLTIRINPAIKPTEENNTAVEAIDKCIWVCIEDPEAPGQYLLSKKIKVESVNLAPYLIVTPPRYDIYISELSGLSDHTVTFTYETNLDKVTVTCDGSNVTTSGITWDNENITLTDSGLSNGTGTVTVTLNNLQDALSAYAKAQTIYLDYTATGDASVEPLAAQTLVNIIPNAQKYRLHFRPLTDDWVNPHIYVYEALYTPSGKEVKMRWQENGVWLYENSLLFGFTGGVTFKGWSTQGGSIDWPNNGLTEDANADPNAVFPANGHGDGSWNPLNTDNGAYQLGEGIYDYSIDFCPDFRFDCCIKFDASNSAQHHNIKWPGVKMKIDEENPGWYYFDLPALASPATTLIMFADGHNGPKGNDDYIKHYRYPAHLVPGVPLYDFADKDGWFLYDYQSSNNDFVDDKPERPDPPSRIVYRFKIGQNHPTAKGVHIWIEGGETITYWDGLTKDGNLQIDSQGNKYFDLIELNQTQPRTMKCLLYYIDNTQSQTQWSTVWQPVTGKEYDYEYTIN